MIDLVIAGTVDLGGKSKQIVLGIYVVEYDTRVNIHVFMTKQMP